MSVEVCWEAEPRSLSGWNGTHSQEDDSCRNLWNTFPVHIFVFQLYDEPDLDSATILTGIPTRSIDNKGLKCVL